MPHDRALDGDDLAAYLSSALITQVSVDIRQHSTLTELHRWRFTFGEGRVRVVSSKEILLLWILQCVKLPTDAALFKNNCVHCT